MLSAVLSSFDCETDKRRTDALCRGPECGRCLSACPGDVIGHWQRDWPACDRYRSPHGFAQLTEHLGNIFDAPNLDERLRMLRSEESFNLWQSILRGAGVVTGCRRCQDVCPVGADYDAMLKDALEEIPEASPEKDARLEDMKAAEAAGEMPDAYHAQARWIGAPGNNE
jgi:ferredoxin